MKNYIILISSDDPKVERYVRDITDWIETTVPWDGSSLTIVESYPVDDIVSYEGGKFTIKDGAQPLASWHQEPGVRRVAIGCAMAGNDYVDAPAYAVFELDGHNNFADVIFVSVDKHDCEEWVDNDPKLTLVSGGGTE
jgi:hypothetical protein